MQDKNINTLKFVSMLLLAGLTAAGMGLLLNVLLPVSTETLVEIYKGIWMI